MYVQEIWRYPVKSMAGERVVAAELGALGVPGDRELAVVEPSAFHASGRVVTARTRPALLLHRATIDESGAVRVDGLGWREPEIARRVWEAAGPQARLERFAGAERFDILPLSVVTDGALAALGIDGRRLRPNLLIGGVPGLAERSWEGRYLAIGDAVIGLDSLRARCVMTTWDPTTLEQDRTVFGRILTRYGGTFALDAWVARPGFIAEGDPVSLLDGVEDAAPKALGRLARSATA
jgi:uncharacterized protein